MDCNINVNKVILVIFILLMFLPYSINILGISLVKIVTILIALIFIYLLIRKRKDIKKILANKFIIFNLLFCFAILLSLIVNYNTVKFNDIYEIAKYITFSMITISVMYICKKKENYLFLLKTISIIFIIVSIFGIVQYFNPFSINELYIKSYAPTQYETLVNDYPSPRIVGVKANPSVYGFLMSLGVFLNLLYMKKSNARVLSSISIALCIINLMLTLTRTIQIAFICSIIIYILINVWLSKGWKKALLAMLGTILGIIVLIIVLPDSITWRLTQVLDISNATSWIGRTTKWAEYKDIIEQNLLFGIGPVKNNLSSIGYVDSELIQILLQYGIVGFVSYALMLLSPFFIYLKNKNYKNILRFYPSILAIIIINNISNTSLILFDSAIGIYIFMGLILGDSKDEISERGENSEYKHNI